ncbi:MAG TPA: chemotaxis protein CheD, partial [Leptospiraceae bacterium]|nr:chemotaxis protein CheD [Leptospiraceae bacterium]HNN59496.1 chemotaxis protein CheD [Leptospiraceae bacterium]
FQCKAFGGGNMFRERVDNVEVIGEKNIRAVEEMTQSGKLVVLSSDLGGAFYRRVQFNVWSGEVWVKRKATEQA